MDFAIEPVIILMLGKNFSIIKNILKCFFENDIIKCTDTHDGYILLTPYLILDNKLRRDYINLYSYQKLLNTNKSYCILLQFIFCFNDIDKNEIEEIINYYKIQTIICCENSYDKREFNFYNRLNFEVFVCHCGYLNVCKCSKPKVHKFLFKLKKDRDIYDHNKNYITFFDDKDKFMIKKKIMLIIESILNTNGLRINL